MKRFRGNRSAVGTTSCVTDWTWIFRRHQETDWRLPARRQRRSPPPGPSPPIPTWQEHIRSNADWWGRSCTGTAACLLGALTFLAMEKPGQGGTNLARRSCDLYENNSPPRCHQRSFLRHQPLVVTNEQNCPRQQRPQHTSWLQPM